MRRPSPAARSPLVAPVAALLLAALAPGAAHALVHDRMPGDDAGGAATLPDLPGIGEDGRAPLHGADPDAVPAPAVAAADAA